MSHHCNRKMVENLKSWFFTIQKPNNLIVKLLVAILLVGLAVSLHLSRSDGFSAVQETPFLDEAISSSPPPLSDNITENADQFRPKVRIAGKCNLFDGDWIPNPPGPAYTNYTCNFIESHQNCMTNGRPDTGYLYWRWSPRDCELPQMNPERFLEMMRNKTWGLIGDSITRNHGQSILCILSKVEQAVLVYHDEEYRSRRWVFPSYNFTVSVFWAPFLAEAAIFEDYNGVSSRDIELHLDKLDKNWTEQYNNMDYIMFSSGKWYIKNAIYYENNTEVGCHGCPNTNLTDIGLDFAYRKVLKKVFEFILESNHKGVIFYRTSTPDHFENGPWYEGGTCKRTMPVKEGEFDMNKLNRILREVELDEFEKASEQTSEKGVNLKLFDVMPLSLLRPDGHPGPYRFFQPFAKDKNATVINDCLHWCLPGPIDSWNDLLMEMAINGREDQYLDP